MNIKILAQNIVNNPSDFTAEQIEKYFEDYAELRLSAVSCSVCPCNELRNGEIAISIKALLNPYGDLGQTDC
jgi:hypothetical protein